MRCRSLTQELILEGCLMYVDSLGGAPLLRHARVQQPFLVLLGRINQTSAPPFGAHLWLGLKPGRG